ncbi:MAG TPA: phosphotransferase family protein [Acidimicrobiia bacterium]|nr:phosphotransferase family protein [Acidimicrobiia bacterium]
MTDSHAGMTATPWRREPDEIARGLARWVEHELGAAATLREISVPDNGMSSETVLFDLDRAGTTEQFVARLAPAADVFPVFPQYDLALQQRCMELVAASCDAPVPTTPWYEPDASWLGAPFLVMGRVHGVVPTDNPPYVFGGWVIDATPSERRTLQTGAARTLAQLHTVTPASHDLTFLARPELGATALDQQVGYQRWYYDWARQGVSYPLIEQTLDWLDARRPTLNEADEHEPVLNWGDARIGNMLWRDFEPVAVLDWEMATVGPPEVDLAWMIFLHAFFEDIAHTFELPGLPDFMRRADMVAEYEALSGRVVRDLEWFEVFAALRFAIVSVRTTARGVAYGTMEPPQDPDDVVMFRKLLEQMLAGTYWG